MTSKTQILCGPVTLGNSSRSPTFNVFLGLVMDYKPVQYESPSLNTSETILWKPNSTNMAL